MKSPFVSLLCFCAIACSNESSPAPKPQPAGDAGQKAAAAPTLPTAVLHGEVSSLRAEISGLNVRVTELGTIVELPTDTLFEFDRWDLGPSAEGNLVKAADVIRRAGPGPIEITGHTDAKGDGAYNDTLSRRRAEAVAEWLRQQVGVRQRQFIVSGKGESAPIAPNSKPDGSDDPDGRAKNRRVELLIRNT